MRLCSKLGFAVSLLVLLAAMLLIALLSASTREPPREHTVYAETFCVYSVDPDTDTVLLESSEGFLYAFTGAEDWGTGDCASVLMDDNGTPDDIFDDAILSARFCGWALSH